MGENKKNNFFSNIPENLPDELFEQIIKTTKFKIKRIVSKGHSSPENFWYDQNENEWIILLKGKAGLLFEDNSEPVTLTEGDFINIPAHQKHRVHYTDADKETIWLAVFY